MVYRAWWVTLVMLIHVVVQTGAMQKENKDFNKKTSCKEKGRDKAVDGDEEPNVDGYQGEESDLCDGIPSLTELCKRVLCQNKIFSMPGIRWEEQVRDGFYGTLDRNDLEGDLAVLRRRLGLSHRYWEQRTRVRSELDFCDAIIGATERMLSLLKARHSIDEDHRRMLETHLNIVCKNAYKFIFYDARRIQNLLEMNGRDDYLWEESNRFHERALRSFYARNDIRKFKQFLDEFYPGIEHPSSKTLHDFLQEPSICHPFSNYDQFTVGTNPYISVIIDLVFSLRTLLDGSRTNTLETVLQKLQHLKKWQHYCTCIIPLVRMIKCIEGLLLCPMGPFSNKGKEYVKGTLLGLGTLVHQYIHYDYLDIDEDTFGRAKSNIVSGNRDEVRTFLHGCIPWLSLRNIQTMLWYSRKNPMYDEIVYRELSGLIEDLSNLRLHLYDLLTHELSEFDSYRIDGASIVQREKSFTTVIKTGSFYDDIAHLEKIEKVLRSVVESDDSESSTLIKRYAMVRALEVIGEGSKHLSERVCDNAVFWNELGKLRNILSHLERPRVNRRLQELLKSDGLDIWDRLENDFRILLKDIVSRLEIYPGALSNIERLPGIERFSHYLIHPLDSGEQEVLYATLNSRETEHEDAGRFVSQILEVLSGSRHGTDFSQESGDAVIETLSFQSGSEKKCIRETFNSIIRSRAISARRKKRSEPILQRIRSEGDIEGKVGDLIDKFAHYTTWEYLSKKLDSLNIVDKAPWLDAHAHFHVLKGLLSWDLRLCLLGTVSTRLHVKEAPIRAELLGMARNNMFGEYNEIIKKLAQLPGKSRRRKLKKLFAQLQTQPFLGEVERQQAQSILEHTPALTDEEADERVRKLMRTLSAYEAWSYVDRELDRIGISKKEPWQKAYGIFSKKRSACEVNEVTSSFSRSVKLAVVVDRILGNLDTLTRPYRQHEEGFDNRLSDKLTNDNAFFYACEHLISSFRKAAKTIIPTLYLAMDYRYLIYSLSGLNQLCSTLINDLKFLINTGNSILHNHDVTEFSTVTSAGRRFYMGSKIVEMLDGIPYGAHSGKGAKWLPSLRKHLNEFKTFVEDHVLLQAEKEVYDTSQTNDPESILYGNLEGRELRFREHHVDGSTQECGFFAINIWREKALEHLLRHSEDETIRSYISDEINELLRSGSVPAHLQRILFSGMFLVGRRVAFEQKIDGLVCEINNLREKVGLERLNAEAILDAIRNSSNGRMCDMHYALIEPDIDHRLIKLYDNLSQYHDQLNALQSAIMNFCGDKEVYEAFVVEYLGSGGWLTYVRGATGMLNALAEILNVNVYVWVPQRSCPNQLVLNHRAEQDGPSATYHLFHTNGLSHFNLLEAVENESLESEEATDDIEPNIQGFSPGDGVDSVLANPPTDDVNDTMPVHADSEEGSSGIPRVSLVSSVLGKSTRI